MISIRSLVTGKFTYLNDDQHDENSDTNPSTVRTIVKGVYDLEYYYYNSSTLLQVASAKKSSPIIARCDTTSTDVTALSSLSLETTPGASTVTTESPTIETNNSSTGDTIIIKKVQPRLVLVNDDPEVWLGYEKSMFGMENELHGIQCLLQSLTRNEVETIHRVDKSIPIRHFRAEKGNIEKAVAQIKKTLAWRDDFGVDKIKECWGDNKTRHGNENEIDNCSRSSVDEELYSILGNENSTGKIYVRGYDKDGRAFMFMTPALEQTNNEMDNMKHLVWNFEKAIACTARKSLELTGKKLDKINLVIDYAGFQLKHAPPVSTTRYTLDILQKHYPERMYHAYLLHPPAVFRIFWSCIKGFVDPTTKEKIVFLTPSSMDQLFKNVSNLQKVEIRAGGTAMIPFNSKQYQQLPIDVSFDE